MADEASGARPVARRDPRRNSAGCLTLRRPQNALERDPEGSRS